MLLYLYTYSAAHCLLKYLQHNTQNSVHYLDTVSHFKIKIASTTVLVMILCFQPIAIAAFQLIHCDKIGGERVLRIDTFFSCFQIWQYMVLIFVVMWVIQFPFYITFLPIVLQSNNTSSGFILLSSWTPTVLLVKCFTTIFKRENSVQNIDRKITGKRTEYPDLNDITQRPYKDLRICSSGSLSWMGIIMLRRLISCIAFTFIDNPLYRILSVTGINLFGIVQLQIFQPYKRLKGNCIELVSTSILFVLGLGNIIEAGFEAANYTPEGPNETLHSINVYFEQFIFTWFPLVIILLIAIFVTLRYIYRIVRKHFWVVIF